MSQSDNRSSAANSENPTPGIAIDDAFQHTGPFQPAADSSLAQTDDTQPPPPDRRTPPGYEWLDHLGRGGMGIVCKARQVKANRVVALKMLLSGDHASDAELQRFQTEAEAVARLDHPNIVTVYDVGEFDGRPYFAMEFCSGGTLAGVLKEHPLPAVRAAEVIRDLARAVAHAHAQGIIHRDLKPGNVLFTGARSPERASRSQSPSTATSPTNAASVSEAVNLIATPKIADFGLAKRIEGDSGHTRTDAIMGTPSYMSPEQAFGKTRNATVAVDVYALGAILYECLTGRAPFKGSTPLETLDQVRYQDPVPPRQLNPRLPRDLETICLECLQKDPTRRYASAADLADECDRFLDGRPIRARPVSTAEKAVRWCRRKPVIAALSGMSVLLALGFVGTLIASTVILMKKNADIEEKRIEIEARNIELAEANETLQRERLALSRQSALNAEQTRYLMRNLGAELRSLGMSRSREKLLHYIQGNLDRLERLTAEHEGMTERVRLASHLEIGELSLEVVGAEPNLAAEHRAKARKHYEQAIELGRRIVERSPDSDLARGNLALCLQRMGQLDRSEKALPAARKALDEALTLRQQIVDSPRAKPGTRDYLFPADTLASLAESHEALFDLSVDEKQGAKGLEHWKKCRELQDRALEMVKLDRSSTEQTSGTLTFEQRVARCLMREAALALARKNPKEAAALLQRAVGAYAEVVAENADSLPQKRDLAMTFFRLGIAQLNAKQYDKARDSFDRMYLLFDQEVKQGDAAQNRDARWTMSLALYGVGFTQNKLGDRVKSQRAYLDCLRVREGLWREDTRPRHAWGLMGAYARCGMEKRALDVLKQEEQRVPVLPDFDYNAATTYSTLAEQVGAGKSDGELTAEDQARRRAHVDSAWAKLKKVKEAGSRRILEVESDPDLEFLQGRADFGKRLEGLGVKRK